MALPLCKLGIRFDHTKGMFYAFLLDFGHEIGGKLIDDLFFALHLILGKKSNWIWVDQFLIQIIAFLNFSEVRAPPPPPPPSPPFQNPAYATKPALKLTL